MTGTLTLAGTPIGNYRDASPRLLEALETFPYIAAEDTRTLVELLRRLGIQAPGKLLSYHEHNEKERAKEIVTLLLAGHDVLVVSDAGMPTISDPGFPVVQEAVAAGCIVSVIPGPSAVLTALALSGLPSDRFTFEGFVPRKEGERTSFFNELREEKRTMIFFEAPHRIEKTVIALSEAFGKERRLVLARELTKKFEEVRRGSCQEILETLHVEPAKGEIVLVLEGYTAQAVSLEDALHQVQKLVESGMRLKDACKQVALSSQIQSKVLYNHIVNS